MFILAAYTSCSGNQFDTIIHLPEPEQDSGISVMEAIRQRRSVRYFSEESISLPELAGILFAAQGITSETGYRAAPSAGATYPLSILIVAENVDSLEPGIYRFDPEENTLTTMQTGYFQSNLARAALGQQCISSAPVTIAITANYRSTTSVYGNRGVMYVHMEAGHVSQNIYLQCTALGLGTVAIGAFTNGAVAEVLSLEENETPLYIMPVGRP
jgi:SagB-type dehydrogenase family enzyme